MAVGHGGGHRGGHGGGGGGGGHGGGEMFLLLLILAKEFRWLIPVAFLFLTLYVN